MASSEQIQTPPDDTAIRNPRLLREPYRNEEAWHDQAEIISRAHRYTTESAVAAYEYEQAGVSLEYWLDASLKGDGVPESYRTSGLGYASLIVGKVVSGQKSPNTLFYADPDKDPVPSKATFEQLLNRKAGGESGQTFTRLLMDTCYPYQKQEGDGFVELPATPPEKAYKTRSYDKPGIEEAKFCANTETHFATATTYPVEFEGATVAMQKVGSGNHTALLTKPAIINGVRIPVGSVLTVNKDDASKPTFTFGRLSPFCLTDPHKAVREFPEIFNKESGFFDNPHYLKGGVPPAFAYKLKAFNELSGRQGPNISAEKFISQFDFSTPWPEVIQKGVEYFSAAIDDPENRRFVNMFREEQTLSAAASEAAARDVAASKGGLPDPRERDSLRRDAIKLRRLYYKFFGAERVTHVEQLIDAHDDLIRMRR